MSAGSAPIHIALTFDDNFWAPAYAVMRSICLTTRRRTDLVFHLCVDAISTEHRLDLDKIASEFGARQIYYDMAHNADFQAIAPLLATSKRFPPVSYARMVLDRIVGPEVERIIYLDSDTLCLAPIEQLYDADLAGQPLGAVADPFRLQLMLGRDIRTKQGLFDPADAYFNSGVLLIDLKRFAAENIPEKVRALGARGVLDRIYFDQDILNLVFSGKWTRLEWRFNVIDPRRAHQALYPHIIHYTGDMRPWKLVSFVVPFHHIYRHVMTNELFYRYIRFRWRQRLRSWGRRLTGRK